jgi:restriction endonuclease S subunit
MKFPPYPKYKPSGVAWLGDVPEHWEVKRGRFVMHVNPPAPHLRVLKPEDEVSFIPMEALGVGGGINLDQTRVLADVTSGYTEFQDGDVVVAKITPCFENGKAALASGLLNGAAYGTTELHVLRAREALNRSFLFYLTISDTFRKLGESEMYGAGGQKRVPPEFAKNFCMLLPPLPEQAAIAGFLDRETGRLDRLVGRKRELIERLKEKRTALISRTVTRGLPPAAARATGLPEHPTLKPSGLPWLGDIPKHWEVKRLKYSASLNDEVLPETTTPDYEFEYVDIGGVSAVGGITATEQVVFERAPSRARRKVRHGDTIVSTVRTYLRAIAPIKNPPENLIVSTGFAVVRPRTVEAEFLAYALRESSFVESVVARSVGVSYPACNASEIGEIPIPLPPPAEQQAIAAYLDRETAKLDALVAKVEAAIERLQEYRTALITAAVTGKIDVRGAAPTTD